MSRYLSDHEAGQALSIHQAHICIFLIFYGHLFIGAAS